MLALAKRIESAIAAGEWDTLTCAISREGDIYRTGLRIHGSRVADLLIDPKTGRFQVGAGDWWSDPHRWSDSLYRSGLSREQAEEARKALRRAFAAVEEDWGRDIPWGAPVSAVRSDFLSRS